MTIADLCLFSAVLLWLGTIGFAKALAWKEFDNAQPRAREFYNAGWRSRALGAHQNSLEALPFFFGAVTLAELRGSAQSEVDALALAFVVARCLYTAAYIGDKALARSVIWSIGFAINGAIFFSPLWAIR